jgi:hypothetical protein
MAVGRYFGRKKILNAHVMYKEFFEDRGLSHIRHFGTPILRYPSDKEKKQLTSIGHIWKTGDRYYKLANKHYGDPRYWWIIAWYNKKPTEAHMDLGDSVYIPTPLHLILEFLGI